jgi:hypothetical protein
MEGLWNFYSVLHLVKNTFQHLKVLSLEMDLTESGFIQWILIIGRVAEIYFSKNCHPPPYPVKSLKRFLALDCLLMGN